MKSKKFWIPFLLILLLAGIGFSFRTSLMQMLGVGQGEQAQAQSPGGGNFDPANLTTTTIRPAEETAQVSASGNIALSTERPVVLQVEGIITEVAVEEGDAVQTGDLLVALDTAALERAVERARLNLLSAQASLDKLTEAADPAEIASAQAALASAQEKLRDLQAGPSEAELAAAEANLKAAQARYQDLLDGPGEAELTQLSASLEKARITLEQAQQAYDRIAYADDVGSSPQAAQLQQATIDYQAAKAAYDIATEPASEADLQSAWSAVQTAQQQLDDLRASPTPADLAAAEAQVASAAAQLENLLDGPSAADLQTAQVNVDKAKLDLQEAEENLAKARLLAPLSGTVLAVNVAVGQKVSPGVTAVTLTDLHALELTVNVAEVDIRKIAVGQPVQIAVDALPDTTFSGEVAQIAPATTSQQGVVNYPVTIRLTSEDLSGVRAGMTAVATIRTGDAEAGWLVPSTAIRERNGQTMVLVLRNGQPTPIAVTRGEVQGEWTVVYSPDLRAGDEAVGGVSSFLNQSEDTGPRGFGPPGGGFGPPGGRNR